jgi:integrase
LIRQWLTTGQVRRAEPPPLSIDDLIARFWIHAETYYQRDGQPTGELDNIRYALRPLHQLFGDYVAKKFGPQDLKLVQHEMISQGLCRNVINRRLCKIKRVFKWAVSEGLLPVRVYSALATVEGLKKYRTAARETAPIRAVSDEVIEQTLPFLPSVIQDMVRIQRLTGCRPGELCDMRPQDVDCSNQPWSYRPAHHKTDHLEQSREVLIGPRAAAILAKYLDRPQGGYCFSPAESEQQRKAAMRARRKSKVQPSQVDRSRPNPQRKPGSHYARQAYLRAIRRACEKAGIPPWSPNRLRHTAATKIAGDFNLQIAQTVLGHKRPDATLIYAEQQFEQAKSVILAVG